MSGGQLLDPRWHWLRASAQRLYAELGPGDAPLSLCLVAADAATSGPQIMAWTVTVGCGGIDRCVVTDLAPLAEAAAAGTIDANPEEPP